MTAIDPTQATLGLGDLSDIPAAANDDVAPGAEGPRLERRSPSTSPEALNLPMETTEHRAVQPIVAEYNRISASFAETPKDHWPRFTRLDDQTFDPFDWDLCFLLGTGYAPRFWQPVLRGHAVSGDIIAPIRKLGETKRKATRQDADVAVPLVNIRSYFMPKRGKQKF